MYVPPTFRSRQNRDLTISNLCDEFLHIEETPEADLCQVCVECNCCVRKSVTCVSIVKDKDDKTVYGKVYKNELFSSSQFARHAEMFFISDTDLRDILDHDQVITLYLTYQPCHFSGGHYKTNHISCTESLQYFHEKVLKPFNICVKIRFAYLYRAHWRSQDTKYDQMIMNANIGLKILIDNFDVNVLKYCDLLQLVPYFSAETKNKWDVGYFDKLIAERKSLEDFISNYIIYCKLSGCIQKS